MDPFYLAILLYVAALTVATIDLFVPSGGMLVALASLAAIGAVLFGFRSSTNTGMLMLTLVIGSIPAFVFTAIKIWPLTPIGRRVILGLPKQDFAPTNSGAEELQACVGRVLLAETALLPMGQLRVGYRRLNALAESGFVEAGAHVEVISVRERNLLIVRQTSKPLSGPVVNSKAPGNSQKEIDSPNPLEQPADELGLDSLDD